jgi:DNA topoisomerase-1
VLEAAKQKGAAQTVERVTFNAITKQAVTEAMAHPRELDTDLIDAYRARRALDYLVGFTLSPVLWRKLPGAKSAGRVQSVALRLIVEREREIEASRPQRILVGDCRDGAGAGGRLLRAWSRLWRGDKIERLSIGKEGDARPPRRM